MRDLFVALRSLRKAPWFAAVSIVSLALAIGANSAIFSLIDAVLLRPLPGIRQPERIASIYTSTSRDSSPLAGVSWPDYLYYREHNQVFSGMLGYVRLAFVVSRGDLPENVSGELASDNYFDVLGVTPQLGRVFVGGERGDDQSRHHNVARNRSRIGSHASASEYRVVGLLPDHRLCYSLRTRFSFLRSRGNGDR